MFNAANAKSGDIEGAVVLCDFLRPSGAGEPGGVDRAAAWLGNAIQQQVARASGFSVELLTPSSSPDLAAWISAQRPPAAADALWAAAFERLPENHEWTEAIARMVLARLRRRFCIGYELPPYLIRLLDRHRIPYIDIRLHPVRFMDDLIFAVRAAHPATQFCLGELAVPRDAAANAAGIHAAARHFGPGATLPDGTLVVVGQRKFDASQIVDGRFFDAHERRAEIAEICARHRGTALKAHPYDPAHSLLTVASRAAGEQCRAVSDNLYRLLAMPEVAAILTVSSSAAYEAPFFGKPVFTLLDLPLRLAWRGEAMPADVHASLDDIVLSVDFWRLALAPYAAVSKWDDVRLPAKPNRLRIALDSFWNFNEVDTDPRPARSPLAPRKKAQCEIKAAQLNPSFAGLRHTGAEGLVQ